MVPITNKDLEAKEVKALCFGNYFQETGIDHSLAGFSVSKSYYQQIANPVQQFSLLLCKVQVSEILTSVSNHLFSFTYN